MRILIDSSVWIDYFRGGRHTDILNQLIDDNIICINDLILAELIPFLKINKQNTIINLLHEIYKVELNIEWQDIIRIQTICLENGINKIGIHDLLIVQNVIINNLILFTFDKHFKLIQNILPIKLFNHLR